MQLPLPGGSGSPPLQQALAEVTFFQDDGREALHPGVSPEPQKADAFPEPPPPVPRWSTPHLLPWAPLAWGSPCGHTELVRLGRRLWLRVPRQQWVWDPVPLDSRLCPIRLTLNRSIFPGRGVAALPAVWLGPGPGHEEDQPLVSSRGGCG